jgi:acyl-CoA synthetase (NDP forming)
MMNTCIKALLQDEHVDSLIIIEVIPERVVNLLGFPFRTPAKIIQKLGIEAGKPVIINTFSSPAMLELLHRELDPFGIPITPSIQNSVKIITQLRQYQKYKQKFS